jgi:hypothetical protein
MPENPYEPPEIIDLARRIAGELGRGLDVEGWIGPTEHQGREYAVRFNGERMALELGELDILAFPHDEQARASVEQRITVSTDRITPRHIAHGKRNDAIEKVGTTLPAGSVLDAE